jgi:hypothetical protein
MAQSRLIGWGGRDALRDGPHGAAGSSAAVS